MICPLPFFPMDEYTSEEIAAMANTVPSPDEKSDYLETMDRIYHRNVTKLQMIVRHKLASIPRIHCVGYAVILNDSLEMLVKEHAIRQEYEEVLEVMQAIRLRAIERVERHCAIVE
jgi:hypothetical protein